MSMNTDLLVQLLQQIFPAIMAFVGVYVGSRGTIKTEIIRNSFEETRRVSNLRINAIERCAQLLQADHEHLVAVRSAAIAAKPHSYDRDPGVEAISLIRIYFPLDLVDEISDYAKSRQFSLEALRHCAIQSALANSMRMAKPASGMNEYDRAMLAFRDEAAGHVENLRICRERIVIALSELLGKQLSKGAL